MDPGTKLKKATEADERFDQRLYQSAIGSLMYLSVCTRPDISYIVSNLARFSTETTKEHWKALKRIFRYLRGTAKYGIRYTGDCQNELIGYSDSDWGEMSMIESRLQGTCFK